MIRNDFLRVLALRAGTALLLVLASVAAAAQPGGGALEVYAGAYSPDNEALDDGATYGARATYRWSDSVLFELTLGRYEDDDDIPGVASFDFELTLLDLSAARIFNPGSRTELSVFGGPGWAFADATARSGPTGTISRSSDSLTLNFGGGLRISLSDRVYLRPDVRARYFEESETVDLEASIGVGFRFGA